MKTQNCLICHKQIYSELGKSCKLCGMILEDKGKEFCSNNYRRKFKAIHKYEKNI